MQVTVDRPQPCDAVMTIEVDDQQMEQARDRAYREYARVVNVPGFRPGKAPRPILEQMLDESSVESRAREIVIGIAYKAALAESGLEPFEQGVVDEVQSDAEPFSFKATVPLRPIVELGDYSSLTVTVNEINVTDEDVEKEVNSLLERRAYLAPATEPATDGDILYTDLVTSVDGQPLGETRTATFQIGQNMPEIDEALRGAVGGDTREADVDYPEDFADAELAGKKVHFTFRVNHAMVRKTPEFTDEWISETFGLETQDELLERIRASLEANARRAMEDDLRRQLIEQVARGSEVHFPTQMVDREVARDLKTFSGSLEDRGSDLDRYLQQTNSTMQQLQDEMAAAATQRLRNGLVMGRLAEVEGLRVSKEDIDREVARIASDIEMKPSEVRRRLKNDDQLEDMKDRLLQEKLFALLKERAGLAEAAA